MTINYTPISVSLAAPGLAKGINITHGASGVVGAAGGALDEGWSFSRIVTTDSGVDVTGLPVGSETVNGLYISYTSSGGAKGIGQAIFGTAYVTGTPAQASNTLNQFVAGQFIGQVTANLGGTNTGAGAIGAIFGIGASAVASSGATNLLNVNNELNVSVASGATTKYKAALSLVALDTDAVSGATYDAALVLSNISGAIGFNSGILFSDPNGAHPVKTSGSLIATQGSATVTYGIDVSSYTFTGAPIVAPLQTPASSGATGKAGSVCWDANFLYVCTATNTWKRAALSTF